MLLECGVHDLTAWTVPGHTLRCTESATPMYAAAAAASSSCPGPMRNSLTTDLSPLSHPHNPDLLFGVAPAPRSPRRPCLPPQVWQGLGQVLFNSAVPHVPAALRKHRYLLGQGFETVLASMWLPWCCAASGSVLQ
jgi:hypothetical protein